MNHPCPHSPLIRPARLAFPIISIILMLMISLFFGLPLRAEGLLSWQNCVREALAGHPDLLSARAQLNQAMADKDIAKSAVLPQLDARISSDRSDSDDRSGTSTHGYRINGSQLLYDGGRTSHQVEAAGAAITSAEYTYDVASSRVRLQLRTAFINLLQARELLVISRKIAERRKQNMELVELRYAAGREHRGSLLSARANVAQAEYEIVSSERAIELAKWRLARELGRNRGDSIDITGELAPPEILSGIPDFENLARQTPFLHELIARKEIALSDKASAKSGFFPQVYADASAGRSDSDWPPVQDQWSVGVSLSIPLFEGGSRLAALKKAEARIRQSLAQERGGYQEIIYTLFSTWTDLQNAVDKVAVGNAFVTASEERARISQVEYSNGLISFDNWAIIEDDLVKNKKTCLAYLTDALVAQAYWLQAKGETLEHDLERK